MMLGQNAASRKAKAPAAEHFNYQSIMKITVNNDYNKVTISEGGHCDMKGLIDRFRKILLALGHDRKEIDKHIIEVEEPTFTYEDDDLPF